MLCDVPAWIIMGCQKDPEVEQDRHLASVGGTGGNDGLMAVTHKEFQSVCSRFCVLVLSNNNSQSVMFFTK